MDYDCTKPLGNELENYLDSDLKKIIFELSQHGIVYEHQFDKLWSMVCKLNAYDISNLFSKKLNVILGIHTTTQPVILSFLIWISIMPKMQSNHP